MFSALTLSRTIAKSELSANCSANRTQIFRNQLTAFEMRCIAGRAWLVGDWTVDQKGR